MTFEAIYFTENEEDDGYRVVDAANLDEAKAVLKAQILAEGTHGDRYHLHCLAARKAA